MLSEEETAINLTVSGLDVRLPKVIEMADEMEAVTEVRELIQLVLKYRKTFFIYFFCCMYFCRMTS